MQSTNRKVISGFFLTQFMVSISANAIDGVNLLYLDY